MEEYDWFIVFITLAIIFLALGYFMGHSADQNQARLAGIDGCTLRSSWGYTVLCSYRNYVLLTSPEEYYGRCYNVEKITGNPFKPGDRICTNTYNSGMVKNWNYCK